MFERFTNRNSLLAAGMSAGALALAGCGGSEKVATPPEGAKQPDQYKYEVILGENYDRNVYLYTDTKPELTQAGRRIVLKIAGTTFCPIEHRKYEGSHQTAGDAREHFCDPDKEVYNNFEVSPMDRVSVIAQGNAKN